MGCRKHPERKNLLDNRGREREGGRERERKGEGEKDTHTFVKPTVLE